MYSLILLDFIIVGLLLFLIGVFGLISLRKNIIIMIMSSELLFFSISFMFIIFPIRLDDIYGQIIVLVLLAVAASESAIGLALLICYYRIQGMIYVESLSNLKG